MSTVGVVVPTRDRPQSLAEAVRSVLGQQGADVSVVVVDEASTPPVDPVAAPFDDARVSVVRTDPPRGPAGARNLGVDHLDTDFVAFLDDDDWWEPTKLARCLEAFRVHPEAGTVVHRARVDGERQRTTPDGSTAILADAATAWVRSQPPHVDCVVARREVHDAVRFDESFPAAADLDYMVRLARAAPVAVVEAVLAVHGAPDRRGPSGVSLERRIAGRRMFREKHADLFDERGAKAFHLARLGHLHRRRGARGPALGAFGRSFVLRPSRLAVHGLVLSLRRDISGRAARPDSGRVLITNVYRDDNRGGAAITAATVGLVRAALPAAPVGLVTMVDDPEELTSSHRHTTRMVDIAVLSAAIPVAGRWGGPAAIARSLVHLALGPRALGATATLREVASARLVLAKGGQLFRSFTWRGLPGLWLSSFPLVFARRCGIPTAAVAVSIGPFKPSRAGRASRALAARVLRACTLVLVRDDVSLRLALEMGVPDARLRRVPDAVFSLDAPPAELTPQVLGRYGLTDAPFIAVTASAHMAEPVAAPHLIPEIATVLQRLLAAGVAERIAVVLQTHGPGTSDFAASKALIAQIDDDRVTLVEDDLGIGELMALYRGARCTIGGRVHSNIFSIAVGTPCFPYDFYGSKARTLLEPVGLDDLVMSIETGSAARHAQAIIEHLADESALRARVADAAARMKAASTETVALLREIGTAA